MGRKRKRSAEPVDSFGRPEQGRNLVLVALAGLGLLAVVSVVGGWLVLAFRDEVTELERLDRES